MLFYINKEHYHMKTSEILLAVCLSLSLVGCATFGYKDRQLSVRNASLTTQVERMQEHEKQVDKANGDAKIAIEKALQSIEACQ